MLIIRDDCAGVFFFQAEDGIRDLVRSRGLGDVYKRQLRNVVMTSPAAFPPETRARLAPLLDSYYP